MRKISKLIVVRDHGVQYFKFKFKYGVFHCDGALIFNPRLSVRKAPLLPLLTISVSPTELTRMSMTGQNFS